MNRHSQHYFDLNRRNPPPPEWAIVGGAFFTFGGLWLLTAFLFSL